MIGPTDGPKDGWMEGYMAVLLSGILPSFTTASSNLCFINLCGFNFPVFKEGVHDDQDILSFTLFSQLLSAARRWKKPC